MKTYVLSFAIATLAAGALAGAQTPSSSSSATSPSSQSSSSTTQTPSSSTSGTYSSSSTDSKAQMKECIAKQKNMNPSISDADAKKACKTD